MKFYGSGFYLYGSRQSDHGTFQVAIDGVANTFTANAPANAPAFQQLIASNDSLELDLHDVRITNGAASFDIDRIDILTGDG